MESRTYGRSVLLVILCMATGVFGYSLGRQTGEEVGRENALMRFDETRVAILAAGYRGSLFQEESPVAEEFASEHQEDESTKVELGTASYDAKMER